MTRTLRALAAAVPALARTPRSGRGARAELDCPVLAEGRYATPDLVRAAFEAGAFAVVIGTATTDPVALTRRFAAACGRSPLHAAR